jgi:hypothetical protein
VVYYAEDITPNVKVGEHVAGGAVIGKANGGPTGIEIGWQTPGQVGKPLAQSTGGYSEGQQTQAGQDFVSWIDSPGVSGTAAEGANGATTDVYQNPVVDQVPATLDPTAAATQYAENQLAPDYQKNNLLRVFQTIQAKLGPQAVTADNVHVLSNPVSMK